MTDAPYSLVGEGTRLRMAALAQLTPTGAFAEVGVYKGGTAYLLAQVAYEQGRQLHLYDTFTGIPMKDAIDHHNVGDFDDVNVEAVRAAIPDAQFHVGVFPITFNQHGIEFAFVHVDCDQYASVKACIDVFALQMVVGGIMWFDDYDVLNGAKQAVDESVFKHRIEKYYDKSIIRF